MRHTVTLLFDPINYWLWDYFHGVDLNSDYQISAAIGEPDAVIDQDIVFILGYTKILPPKWLVKNRLNLVIHESNLPQGSGFSPVQWQILKGWKNIPVWLLEASEEVDSGDLILLDHIILDGTELYDEIRAKQAETTIRLIKRFLEMYPDYPRRPQTGDGSIYRKRTPADSEIFAAVSIAEQFNTLRICNNDAWPAFFHYRGQRYVLKIEKADMEAERTKGGIICSSDSRMDAIALATEKRLRSIERKSGQIL